MKLRYHVVDVFTHTAFEGNPLAVFPEARGLDGLTMQRIAREFNLSETTFVFPPDDERAAARVRIFTPFTEMKFAGHPTIGTAYVMRELKLVAEHLRKFALQEQVGFVPIRVGEELAPILWLTTPAISIEDVYDSASCAQSLGLTLEDVYPNLPCQILSAGNPTIFVPLKSREAVDRAVVDTSVVANLFRDRIMTCIFAFTPTSEGAYSRMFAPALGVLEDPATGSATGPLAAYMMRHGLVSTADGTRFISEQGTKMGRRSILHVLIHVKHRTRTIEVGGNVTPIAVGELEVSVPRNNSIHSPIYVV